MVRRVLVQYLLADGDGDVEVEKFFMDFRASVPQDAVTCLIETHVPGFPDKTRVTLSAVAGDFGDMLIKAVESGRLQSNRWGHRQIGQIFTTCPQQAPVKKTRSQAKVNV